MKHWKTPKWFIYMEQESRIAIIGGGPAGCTCAYFLQNYFDVTIFDTNSLMFTILKTGGGRCNFSYDENDFKELSRNYPRGEKFLYSVFSNFSPSDTVDLFNKLGIETYTQKDKRMFPKSNSAKEVREKFLASLNKIKHIKKTVLEIKKNENGFILKTNSSKYFFDKVIYATGGHSGYKNLERLGIPIVSPKPSLVGYVTEEDFSDLAGMSLTQVYSPDINEFGDIIFTHKGISGPLIYKISSIKARDEFPFEIYFDLIKDDFSDIQNQLNKNSQKLVKSLLSDFLPKHFCEYAVKILNISDKKCHEINGVKREEISNFVHRFKVKVVSTVKDGETVTAGGVDLNHVNPKNMESKIIPNLYFCGEVLNIDGFCGGFNLQNCWATAFVLSKSLK